jgi:hypothetical protein
MKTQQQTIDEILIWRPLSSRSTRKPLGGRRLFKKLGIDGLQALDAYAPEQHFMLNFLTTELQGVPFSTLAERIQPGVKSHRIQQTRSQILCEVLWNQKDHVPPRVAVPV